MASQISTASCSTSPGSGKCWVNSRYDDTASRSAPGNTARLRTPVVPASMAITKLLVTVCNLVGAGQRFFLFGRLLGPLDVRLVGAGRARVAVAAGAAAALRANSASVSARNSLTVLRA